MPGKHTATVTAGLRSSGAPVVHPPEVLLQFGDPRPVGDELRNGLRRQDDTAGVADALQMLGFSAGAAIRCVQRGAQPIGAMRLMP